MGVVAGAALAGLALGVAALVLSVALLAGFQKSVLSRLAEETPHVLVTPAGRDAFRDEDGIAAALARVPGVVRVGAVVRGRAWLTAHSQTAPAWLAGRDGVRGLVLDPGLSRSLLAGPGDSVMAVSSRSRLSPLGPVPITASFEVSNVARAPGGRRTAEGTVPIADARRLFALGAGGATGYEVALADPGHAAEAERLVRAALGGGIATATWEEANRPLVLALRLERLVLFATVFLIVVVAGLNLAATSAVLVATRRADAAVLSVLGASPRTLAAVFLAAGTLVGTLGTATGLVAGAALAVVLDLTRAIPLPAQLFALAHVPFRVQATDVLAIGLFSLSWSLLAASLPARAAMRLDVTETLRAG